MFEKLLKLLVDSSWSQCRGVGRASIRNVGDCIGDEDDVGSFFSAGSA